MSEHDVIYIQDIIDEYEEIYDEVVCRERALPHINDGMIYIYRRILWVMLKNQGYKRQKSAATVGETVKYHPHSESGIYDSLCKMVDCENPLITGQGNWGYRYCLDPAKPAAMRYTECKLNKFVEHLYYYHRWADLIVSETGYKEPVFFPVLIPYALLNYFEGISAGAGKSNVPTFKLQDLLIRQRFLVCKKYGIECELPNKYPTPFYGSKVTGLKVSGDIAELFKCGKGKISIEPKYKIDEKKQEIEVTAIYPRRNIKGQFNSLQKNLGNLVIIRDLSGRKGMRIVVKYNTYRKRKDSLPMSFKKFTDVVIKKLTENVTYNITVYRGKNDYPNIGIDEWLLHSFEIMREYEKRRIQFIIKSLNKKIRLQKAIILVRPLYQKYITKHQTFTSAIITSLNKEMERILGDVDLVKEVLSLPQRQIFSSDLDIKKLLVELQDAQAKLSNDSIQKELLFNHVESIIRHN